MNAIVDLPTLANPNMLQQVDVEFDETTSTMFWWMRPAPRPCFNSAFLLESAEFERRIELHQGWLLIDGVQRKVENAVFGSVTPGIFNLGGDLGMFLQAVLRKDRKALTDYGRLCVDNMYRRIVGYGAEVATYSLVQGKAFGGGFECALASDYIVAERSATMSFPEILFNMFPGMGALSLLTRKVGPRVAEQIITSGKVYTAREMFDLGVVDQLAEDGTGREVVTLAIKSRQRRRNAIRALNAAKQYVSPLPIGEMHSIVDVWVDAVLRLETRDLRMMARLVKAQDRLLNQSDDEMIPEDVYEPRLSIGAQAA